jgi:hypothetical protein
MKHKLILVATILSCTIGTTYSQKTELDSTFRRHFIGSSGFMLYNLVPNQVNPPSFYQLNYGYWITKKDVISIEAKTWTYRFPLGIPYGFSFEAPEEAYSGKVRGFGIGIAYQRFLWKGLYSAIHASSFLQEYSDKNNVKIQNGFQLFTALRMGYHIKLFKNRFFIEPSFAGTFWPINTNVPEAFAVKERKWNNFFLVEPGLHFGVKF